MTRLLHRSGERPRKPLQTGIFPSPFFMTIFAFMTLLAMSQTAQAIKCYFCDFRVANGFDDECSTADTSRFETIDCPLGVHTCARYEYASGNKLSIGCGPAGLSKPGQAQTWRGVAHHCTGDLCNGHKTTASSLVKDAAADAAGGLPPSKGPRGGTAPITFGVLPTNRAAGGGSGGSLAASAGLPPSSSRLPVTSSSSRLHERNGGGFIPPSTFQPRPQQITPELTIERVPVDGGADNFRPAATLLAASSPPLFENINSNAGNDNLYPPNDYYNTVGSNTQYNDFGSGDPVVASASRHGYFPYYRASATTASSASMLTLILAALSVVCAALLAGGSGSGWPTRKHAKQA